MATLSERKKLGKKIRRLRKEAGLSQEDLGDLSDLHRTYIGSVERGEQNVSVDNIAKIARALRVKTSQLFE